MSELEVCCDMRKKVSLLPVVYSEKACGVSDSVLADFLLFDEVVKRQNHDGTESEVPIMIFQFCPWCGSPFRRQGKGVTMWPGMEGEGEPG